MTDTGYLSLLPEKAGEHIKRFALSELIKELGEEMLVFKSEMIRLDPEIENLLMDGADAIGKSVRVASCRCTACGETFYCSWLPKNINQKYGIRIFQGEDGLYYDGIADIYGLDTAVECYEGDQITCPKCNEIVSLIHSSKINSHKIFQVGVSEIQNLGDYTSIITWLVKRTVYRNGAVTVDSIPFGAVILDGKKLMSFKHFKTGMFGQTYYIENWYKNQRYGDPTECMYYDSASYYSKKKGAALYSKIPELKGKSGEKTGLARYIKAGGEHPAAYLEEWKRHPAVENFLYTGWETFVVEMIRESRNLYYPSRKDYLWDRRKPNEMLCMNKTEYKALASKKWSLHKVRTWMRCVKNDLPFNAVQFDEMDLSFVDAFADAVRDRKIKASEFQKIEHYLKKQRYPSMAQAFRYLLDHWQMTEDFLKAENIHRDLTDEERYPRNIMQAHEADLNNIKASEDKKMQEKFDAVYEKYSSLEWSDGEFCVIIPRSESELIKEGRILRHCVGSYGNRHAEGKNIILFIRHYRRPERNYYTLNIDFTSKIPKEIQFHGYGNERHGENKEYSHSIPKKVREFVDRWEKDVLMPWANKRNKEIEKTQKKSA